MGERCADDSAIEHQTDETQTPRDAWRPFYEHGNSRQYAGRQEHLPEYELKWRGNPRVRPDVDDVRGPTNGGDEDQAAAELKATSKGEGRFGEERIAKSAETV